MKKPLRIVILLSVLAGVTGLTIAYFQWNKPHKDIENTEADHTFSTADLIQKFAENEVETDKELHDKVLQINGTIKKIIPGDSVCSLVFDAEGNYEIRCEILPEHKSEVEKMSPGTAVMLKGLYVGFMEADEDFDIPGDIILKKGSVVQ